MRHHQQQPMTIVVGHERDMMPKTSWWLGLERAAFFTRCREELDRMERSRFGRLLSNGTLPTEAPAIGGRVGSFD